MMPSSSCRRRIFTNGENFVVDYFHASPSSLRPTTIFQKMVDPNEHQGSIIRGPFFPIIVVP